MDTLTDMEDQVPPKTPDPLVWIVGDWKQAEFGEPVEWLKTQAKCLLFDNAAAALLSLRTELALQIPTAIVLVQSRPGQINRSDVERLHAAAPLARLVGLEGSWCEGVVRGGREWRGIAQVPASSWRYCLGRELGLANQGGLPLPTARTATAAERIEAGISRLHRHCVRGARAIVVSPRRANYEAIAELLQQFGITCVWQGEPVELGQAADVVVFDGWEQVAAQRDGATGQRPVSMLLLHFPDAEDFERAEREGILAVVALPLLLTDVADALSKALSIVPVSLAGVSGL